VLGKELSEEACVSVGVVTTNDSQTIELELFYNFQGRFKLLSCLDFVPSGAYHVEAAHVAVKVHVLSSDLHVITCIYSVRSSQKPKENTIRMNLFGHVIKPHNYVVAACCLSSTQYTSKLKIKKMVNL